MYMLRPEGTQDGIIRLEDKAWIPADELNGDWLTYLAWLQLDPENNQPVPYDSEVLYAE